MMFAHEEFEHKSNEQREKPQFEAGFNRSNDIVVNITKSINNENIILLIATIDEWVEKFYLMSDKDNGCKVICLFDAYGDDYSCVTTFNNYMKTTIEKYPKLSFVGVLQYAEGNVALMYMLLSNRVVRPSESANSQSGPVKLGQSALKFNVIQPQFKNEIAKLLIENKIKKELLPLCFPPDDVSAIQYCGEVVFDDGFGTTME